MGVLCVSGSGSSQAFQTFGASAAVALSGHLIVIAGAGHLAHLHTDFRQLLHDHIGLP
ncbi:MAG: hypothetical protein ACR2HR_04765 [Euzebya sp.]